MKNIVIISICLVLGWSISLSADEEYVKKYDIDYFIGATLGYSWFNIQENKISGNIILNDTTLDNSSFSENLQAGLKYQKYILTTNYEYLSLDQANMHNLYVSLDYEFDMLLKPFIGVSLGMANLNWIRDPLVKSKKKDASLASLLYGVQAGISYKIFKNLDFYSIFRYQKFNLRTALISTPAKSEIVHHSQLSLDFGIRYFFSDSMKF